MISEEENALLTLVGPGTPMGDLLRRYWMPIAAETEFDVKETKYVCLMGKQRGLEVLVIGLLCHAFGRRAPGLASTLGRTVRQSSSARLKAASLARFEALSVTLSAVRERSRPSAGASTPTTFAARKPAISIDYSRR